MSAASKYLLAGIDGGGTGCRVAIENATGKRLGEAVGGPANYTTDPDTTIRSIRAALDLAAERAGLAPGWAHLCIAHIGLAGVMSTADAQHVARSVIVENVTVTDDRETSVAGALGEREGMLAAIGTGTIVAGRKDGKIRFFGGWGHHLADQASGGWLGRSALRRTMLAYDGLSDHSPLTLALLARFGDDPIAMISFAGRAGPGDFASLARMVVDAALNGDEIGQKLMRKGAAYLCTCVDVLDLAADDVLCLSGGVGPHYDRFLPDAHSARIRPPNGTALDGAIALARRTLETQEGVS